MKYFLLTAAFYLIVGYAVGQVEQGLVAKYYFNNQTFEDEIGNIDGDPSNILFTTDRFNNPFAAIRFHPDDQSSVSYGDNFDELFALIDGSFSFSFWVKTSDTSINQGLIMSKYGNSNCGEDQREFFIRVNSENRIEMVYYSALVWSTYRIIEGSTQILDTLWHHLVINYDGAIDENDGLNRVNMYFDNGFQEVTLLEGMGPLGDIQNGTAHLSLGTPLGSSGNFCGNGFPSGHFDDFRLYNRQLNEDDVDTLFNESNPQTGNYKQNLIRFNINIYPNPFTTSTTLSYELKQPEKISLSIYNHLGQLVYQIEENQPQGSRQLIWNAERHPDGVYYYRLKTGDDTANGKLVKVR